MEIDEEELKEIIRLFYNDKKVADEYKKSATEYNEKIKDMIMKLGRTEYQADNLVAKISIQNRESFLEDKLVNKIKELGANEIIKTKEYVDMDMLEDYIYNGKIDATELTDCKTSKEVITLKVTEKKGK